MHIEEHNHCFMHYFGVKTLSETPFPPPLMKPGYGARRERRPKKAKPRAKFAGQKDLSLAQLLLPMTPQAYTGPVATDKQRREFHAAFIAKSRRALADPHSRGDERERRPKKAKVSLYIVI